MEITKDWNEQFILNTIGIHGMNLCLEIGCFEGLTSNYIVDSMLSNEGKLICVDPLGDSYLTENLDEDDLYENQNDYSFFEGQYRRFMNNTEEKRKSGKIQLYREISSKFYENNIELYREKFDFIYIDGDHRPESVYLDAINCFEMCKSGGLILFDDYEWKKDATERSTKLGIDRFMNEFSDKCRIKKKNYQLLVEKL